MKERYFYQPSVSVPLQPGMSLDTQPHLWLSNSVQGYLHTPKKLRGDHKFYFKNKTVKSMLYILPIYSIDDHFFYYYLAYLQECLDILREVLDDWTLEGLTKGLDKVTGGSPPRVHVYKIQHQNTVNSKRFIFGNVFFPGTFGC